MEIFDNFGALDGLIQIEISSWDLELGLVGGEARWWRGSWDQDDVHKFAGSKVTDKALETFAGKVAQYIVSGEMSIKGWDDDERTDLQLNINPTGKSPITVQLTQLSSGESSAKAMNILKGIALQAQSRGCQLQPSVVLPPPLSTSTMTKEKAAAASSSAQEEVDQELRSAQERIKRLENEVDIAKKTALLELKETAPSKPMPPKPPPGASRANPSKKKRKIVAAEFEDE